MALEQSPGYDQVHGVATRWPFVRRHDELDAFASALADGSENAETVSFGFRGATCEVDLAKKNQAKLEKARAPFIGAGRTAPAGGRRRTASRAGGPSADRTAVRAWAKTAGLKVSERGRISADVMRRYEEAH